jgi:hypothetical protein
MALVVEDGTIIAGAESYLSTTDYDNYLTARGRVHTGSPTVTQKEQWLRIACQQMEARYRLLWKGSKRNDSLAVAYQPLSWPRTDVVDEDEIEIDDQTIPQLVKNAQAEIAWLVESGRSFVTTEVKASDVQVTSESVGPISVSYSQSTQHTSTFPLIDQMLVPLANVSGVSVGAYIGLTAEEELAMAQAALDLTDTEFFNPI